MRFSLPSSLSLGLVALISLSGCGFSGSSAGATQAAKADQRIVVDNFRAPVANWALESDAAYILSLSGCLETLTRYDEAQGKIVPLLATEWKQVSPLEWDFTIRGGVKFQDGSALSADAVAGSLQKVLAAAVPARAFNPKVVTGVKAVDDRTVRVSTPTESPLVPYRLASVNTGILAPAAFKGDTVDPFGHCTGPFEPVSEKPKQSLTLDRNEAYWGGEVQLAGAEVRFITDGATRAAQVQTGEADVSLSIPVSGLPGLESDASVKVLKSDSPRTATLYMNNGRAPFDDVDFRKAVRSALDLDALAASVYEGAAVAASGPFAPSEPWAVKGSVTPKQDLEGARKLLATAGYTADRPLEVIAIVERAEFADVATVIQEDLKAVGIPVKIQTKEYAAAEPDLLAGNYDMVLSQRNRLIDIADPIGFLTADYTCDGTYNLSHFCNKDYDATIAKAATTADADERYRLYAEAGQILQEQAVNVWLVNEQAIDAVRADLQAHVQDPLSRYVVRAETAKP
ncbi:peptide/nickel transport system substrate-binding protein [Arthrobacter sp. V4I6]|uniref:ABC transporter substrate-binding protein n=1 Tax=unclassified Arthrobacter TaxID=235627 RepID=UPI0027810025|nr:MULTISPECIES: ABC transporter substrate-binding protein [unclassified Arthrobacter]MDQ0819898.1 peptide/nickel transport system substrate-binding protein [Arthrobacter sp. V1I7]MDQ0854079.1 peptide/nickel transport system substrate-binding protein [Arthrobacter sp. V4I6]